MLLIGYNYIVESVNFTPVTRDYTEKIWAHGFFAKQKTDVPKAHKIAAGGLGSTVSLPVGFREQSPQKVFIFFV